MARPCGSTLIVYVPVVGRVIGSMNLPLVANVVGLTTVPPAGLITDTWVLEIVSWLKFSDSRCPAVPANVSWAF